MDLIYMNDHMEDVGVLHDYDMDLAFGVDENNFECKIHSASHCCNPGYFLYIEGTEYGGVVDAIESRTEDQEIIYSGRTWHGILESKIIMPLQSGEASSSVTIKETDSQGNSLVDRYLIISGDASSCLQFIIDRIGVADMFVADSSSTNIQISQYQFHRFTDAYNGIVKMLSSAGAKLKIEFRNGKAVLSAVPKYDYSQDAEFDSDQIALKVRKKYNTVNHLVCLGKGELENRQVIHLYADENGNVSRTQTMFGMDEIAAIYEYSVVESAEELETIGTEHLQAMWIGDELSVSLIDEDSNAYDVGDVVGGIDNVTRIAVTSSITKKVVSVKNGQITVVLSTGVMTTSGAGATGDGSIYE